MLRKFQVAGLAAALALTLAGIAQGREHRDDRGGYAYQNGYRAGFEHGQMDRSRGAGYNYRDDEYQDADRGYNPDSGNRDEYRESFRDGYVAGYNDAYYGRPGRYDSDDYDRDHSHHGDYGRGDGSVAARLGYQDGFAQGRKDAAERKKFKPEKHDDYKDGDRGYHHEYGDKKLYKSEYRQAYVQGYQEAYNGPGQY